MNGNKRIPSLENKRYYLWRYEKVKSSLSTLCYIEKDDKYLMIHRVKKKHDVNKDKWIGIGGKFERGESPEECVLPS